MAAEPTFWGEIADLPHTVKYVQVGRWRTRVLEIGSGEETVLLLNGTSGHIEAWLHNVRALAQHYRVIGYDYPGHGYTTLANESLEIPTYEEHLLELLDTLELDRVHLMGESLGGWIGVKFAAKHPDRLRTLVLSAPGGRMIGKQRVRRVSPVSSKAVTDPTFENVKARLQVVIHDPEKITDELVQVRRAIYSQPGFVESMRSITVLQDPEIRAKNQVTDADYAAIPVPTLLVWTDHEPSGGVGVGEHLAGLIPDGKFVLIENAAHWPQWEDPETFNKHALEFLTAHSSKESPMTDLIAEIANDLYQARLTRTPIDFVRERIAFDDKDSAYAINETLIQTREREEGRKRVGRKVGLTNPVVQKRAGVDEPDYGIILDNMVFDSGVERPIEAYRHAKIEAELAFVLKEDILDSSIEAVKAAIDYVVPAFEIVDNRYHSYAMKIADTIADNAACEGIVLGDVRIPYGEVDLREVEMVLTVDGEEVTRGVAVDVMGDPVNAIQWLAETSIRIGRPLRAGEVLLSGSIGLIVDWTPNVPVVATYSHGFGEVRATLIAGDSND